MSKNINFLRQKVVQLKKKAKQFLVIRTISLAVAGIYGLVVLAVFSYFLFIVERENKTLKQDIAKEIETIEGLFSVETKQVYLAAKTKPLSEILPQKKKYQQVLESFLRLFPEDIYLTGLEIKEDGKVDFSGRCFSFISLDNFLAALRKAKEVRVEELSYGFGEGYSFKMSLLFFNQGE